MPAQSRPLATINGNREGIDNMAFKVRDTAWMSMGKVIWKEREDLQESEIEAAQEYGITLPTPHVR